MQNSPLGQYAPLIAAVTCLGLIFAYIVALIFAVPLALPAHSIDSLQVLAVAAFGAVVGSSVAVNGWKGPLTSLHSRVDSLEGAAVITAAAAGLPPSTANTHDDAGDAGEISGV